MQQGGTLRDATGGFEGLPVLLVDDNAGLRRIVALTLESLGCTVTSAADATEAMGVLQEGNALRLMLSDVRMPGPMDGIALAEWVAERHPQIAILLMTGYTETGRVRFPLLNKPFGPEELIDALATVLRASTGSRVT